MSIENYGRYQLLKRIATGGMAEIHLARLAGGPRDARLVVKRILPHLAENAEFVQMFLDEARIAARLNHPNIAQISDLGAQGGTYFIAMEYIHGEDVRRIWKRAANRGITVPQPLVCRIIADACAGLDFAHRKTDGRGRPLGIVHRDVSPQNILVTFDGAVKVVDFGIAKAADQATVTQSGVLKGKYSYMSPEQASGLPVDGRSDLFALGVVLHELLTGTRLFKRENDLQTLHAVGACEVAPPSRDNPNVPPELDAIVLRALAKEPRDRYPDAGALREALEGWLSASGHRATRAELAAFLRALYADRLAEEGDVAAPSLEEARDLPRSLETSVSERMTELVARVGAAPEVTQPVDDSPELSVPTEAMSLPGAGARRRVVPAGAAGPAAAVPRGRRAIALAAAASAVVLAGWQLTRYVAGEVLSAEAVAGQVVSGESVAREAAPRGEPPVAERVAAGPAGTGGAGSFAEPSPEAVVLAGASQPVPPPTREVSLAGSAPPPAVRSASVPKPVAGSRPGAQTGIVRFIVTPWGEVRCDGVLLGRTPFGERELRAGTHACEVTHPQLGTVRRQVEVKANAVEKVLVQFKE